MAVSTGTLEEIMVFEDYGWIKMNGGTTLIIWSDYVVDYSPTQRLVHGMWLALLRDALTNGLNVEVVHDSSVISIVTLLP